MLGGLGTTEVYFLQFWKLEVKDHGSHRTGDSGGCLNNSGSMYLHTKASHDTRFKELSGASFIGY